MNFTHSDTHVRVVSFANLQAMCRRISRVCHVYAARLANKRGERVHVSYTGPRFDEVGYQEPDHMIVAVLPAYGDSANPNVILDILNVLYDDTDGEGWQSFDPLMECPTLWPEDHLREDTKWRSRKEIDQALKREPTPYTGYRYVEKFPDGSVRDCFPEREG